MVLKQKMEVHLVNFANECSKTLRRVRKVGRKKGKQLRAYYDAL